MAPFASRGEENLAVWFLLGGYFPTLLGVSLIFAHHRCRFYLKTMTKQIYDALH